MPEAGDRTERATPRPREEARKHGPVAPWRVSPANGLKRIFSANGAMNLVKAVVKIALVAAVAYRVLLRTGAEAIGASGMTPAELIGFTGTGLRRLFLTMALALAVLGGL